MPPVDPVFISTLTVWLIDLSGVSNPTSTVQCILVVMAVPDVCCVCLCVFQAQVLLLNNAIAALKEL